MRISDWSSDVCSSDLVSLDPPLLLVCIANSASSGAILREAERFAVNVLQIGQQPASNRFAGKGEDRYAATPWAIGEFGPPVLHGSLSSFQCARAAVPPGGDHLDRQSVMLGQRGCENV